MFAPPPFLNLVRLRSADLDATESFYSVMGMFGARKVSKNNEAYLEIAVYRNGPVLEFYLMVPGVESTSSVRIRFNIDTVGYIDDLVDAGGELVQDIIRNEEGEFAIVKDPDGHEVELVSPVNRKETLM